MPALVTHYLFADMAKKLLPQDVLSTPDELAVFTVGNQGPDPLFFRHATSLSGGKTVRDAASRLHREKPLEVFRAMYEQISHFKGTDARLARAFALGFMGHYALDSNAHPIIYAQQYKVVETAAQKPGKNLDEAQYEVHAIIESDLDVWLLWQLRHATTADMHPADLLVLPEAAEVPAGMEVRAGAAALGLDIPMYEYAGCVGDMRRVYRLIEPAGSRDTKVIGMIERLFRTHSMMESLAHHVAQDPDCAWTNEAKHEWENPFTHEKSSASFLELVFSALEMYAKLAACMLSGEFDESLFRRNYSGGWLE